MTVFIDTSALYAFMDGGDVNHSAAVRTMTAVAGNEPLITHNYVVVETSALVHRRLGAVAARAFFEDVIPSIDVGWITPEVHAAATSAFLAAVRRRTSFVDWTSFEVMRRSGIRRAFAFDRDFAAQGFEVIA